MKDFHSPPPDESCPREQLRKAQYDAIAAYAAENAGTALDLDVDLEAASVDHLS